MITLTAVSKSFKNTKALSDIHFSIGTGQVVGFLGPNGAGKTTTMRILTGFYKADSGTVFVNNTDPWSQRIQVSRMVGYLPENNPLYTDYQTIEYLRFIRNVKHSSNTSEDDLSIQKIISVCGIEEVLYKQISQLSRGFRQRVGLAATLIGNPKILILDEPTSGLDPIEQDHIHKLIRQLGKKKTVILSTHILSEVEKICTRVLIIRKGNIVYDNAVPKRKGTLEKIFKNVIAGKSKKKT